MGTTSEKLTYLNETKTQLKDTINYSGASITNDTFRQYPRKLYAQYLGILKDNGNELFNNMPKNTAQTGTNLTLNNTVNTRMGVELSPSELQQATTYLPSGYTQVEYIESNKTQLLYTTFPPYSGMSMELDFAFNDTTTEQLNGVHWTSSAGFALGVVPNLNSSKFVALLGNTYATAGTLDTNRHYGKIKINSGTSASFTVDNETTTITTTYTSAGKGITLFCRNNYASYSYDDYCSMKLYGCKIYRDNEATLVANYVPCFQNSNNAIGLYDTVSGTFKKQDTGNNFTKGNNAVLPNPDYPVEVQVIKGNNSIKIENKNLFDENDFITKANSVFNVSKENDYIKVIKTGSASTYLYPLSCKENTQYSIQFDFEAPSSNYYIRFKYSDNTYSRIEWETAHSTFASINATSTANKTVVGVDIQIYSTNSVFKLKNIQLEEGTATDYVAHQEQVLPLNLPNGMEYCKIGTYEDEFEHDGDKWYLNKYIDKVALGNLSYTRGVMSGGNILFTFQSSYFGNYYGVCVKCSHFLGISDSAGNVLNSIRRTLSANSYIVTSDNSDTTSTTAFKNWLTNNNVNAYFIRTTPTHDEITDTTLISQLNAIEQAVSYDEQTNISQTNAGLPFRIKATTIKSLNEIFN